MVAQGQFTLSMKPLRYSIFFAQALDVFLGVGVEATKVLVLGEEFVGFHQGEFSGDYAGEEVRDAVAVNGDIVGVGVRVVVNGDVAVTDEVGQAVFGVDEAFVVTDGFGFRTEQVKAEEALTQIEVFEAC